MPFSLSMLFILFILYSFLGWFLESIYCYYKTKKLVNRGFLIGPICPIYGVGCVLIISILYRYSQDWFVLFVVASIICTILEYFTSYIMEKLFKARWWDYSDKHFNINGRVCLENAVAFGVLAVLLVRYINPFTIGLLDHFGRITLNSIAIIFLVFFISDLCASLNIINNFKKTAFSIKKDNTEEITKRVKEILIKRGGYYKRLVSAFDFKVSFRLIKDITLKLKDEAMKTVNKTVDKLELKKNHKRNGDNDDKKRKRKSKKDREN